MTFNRPIAADGQRLLLAPAIFLTVVTGIARMENMKEPGRVGFRALIYFEVVSTLALVVGLVVVDVFKPGASMNIDVATLDTSLQIVLFSILLGIALAHVGPRAKVFVDTLDRSACDHQHHRQWRRDHGHCQMGRGAGHRENASAGSRFRAASPPKSLSGVRCEALNGVMFSARFLTEGAQSL